MYTHTDIRAYIHIHADVLCQVGELYGEVIAVFKLELQATAEMMTS